MCRGRELRMCMGMSREAVLYLLQVEVRISLRVSLVLLRLQGPLIAHSENSAAASLYLSDYVNTY